MKSVLGKFIRSTQGNFGVAGAVAVLPMVIAIGYAVDYATLTRVKTELQQATDAAVLAIAREGIKLSQAKSEEIAAQFLEATLDKPFTNLKVVRDEYNISVSADVDAGLSFGNLFGFQNGTVEAVSAADITTAAYEIGLVLDTTGSMKGGKLAAMKDAVNGLVDTMANQVTETGKLKFAVVPFASFVNVGSGFGPSFDHKGKQVPGSGEPWLDRTGQTEMPESELSAGASRFQLYRNVGKTWSGCVETRYAPGTDYDVDDTTPSATKPGSLFVPAFAIDEPDEWGFQNSYIDSDARPRDSAPGQKKKRWRKYWVDTNANGDPLNGGLIDSLLQFLFGSLTVPIDSSMSYGLPKGPGRGCDVQPIVPLTTNLDLIKAKVAALQANGNTNITEGVGWGRRVLSPTEPFTQGAPASKKFVRRIMIVLTDGSNTFGNVNNQLGSTYSSYGYLSDGRLDGITSGTSTTTNAGMNDRTLRGCELAKAAGLEIYTIRLEEPNVTTGTMLKDCASDLEHYFDVPNRSMLDEAFQGIKDKIVVVRLAS